MEVVVTTGGKSHLSMPNNASRTVCLDSGNAVFYVGGFAGGLSSFAPLEVSYSFILKK